MYYYSEARAALTSPGSLCFTSMLLGGLKGLQRSVERCDLRGPTLSALSSVHPECTNPYIYNACIHFKFVRQKSRLLACTHFDSPGFLRCPVAIDLKSSRMTGEMLLADLEWNYHRPLLVLTEYAHARRCISLQL